MKVLAVFLCLAVGSTMAFPFFNSLSKEWNKFKALHKKVYSNVAEEMLRMKIYLQNKLVIYAHHAKYKLGLSKFDVKMNQFGDLLQHEFRTMSTGINATLPRKTRAFNMYIRSNKRIPANYDARKDNLVVTPIQQGLCGGCWAFSTTGAIEGQIAKKTGKLIPLSQQNLLDCSLRNNGCKGGMMSVAFDYIQRAGGLQANSTYPYTGEPADCKFDPSQAVVKVTGYRVVRSRNDYELKDALYNVGPVSIAIDGSSSMLAFYKGGIFSVPPSECNPFKVTHGVLAVGYGNQGGQSYWLVKNSWGPEWGEGGFVKILNDGKNLCGVTTMPSIPTVELL